MTIRWSKRFKANKINVREDGEVNTVKQIAERWERKGKSGLLPFHLFAFLLFITACSTIDCPVQNTVAVYYGICAYDNGEEVTDTLTDTLYVWSQRSDGKDTLLLNRGVNISSFSLPASYSHPEDILVFYVVDTTHVWTLDTVWLKKDDIPHFESVDCSAHFFHELTAVRSSHRGIDTIIINNPSVTYDPTVVNLHIHFKNRR